jgi:hypothetical protein
MRSGEIVGIDLGNGWYIRQAGKSELKPGRGSRQQHDYADGDENRRPNPDAKAAISRVVDGGVCRIERDHWMSPEIRFWSRP